MFLGFLGKLFSNSELIEKYANLLFDEFIANKNAKAALDKAAEFARQNKMSTDEVNDGKKKAAEKINDYLPTVDNLSENDLSQLKELVDNIPLQEDKKRRILKSALNRQLIVMADRGELHEFDKSKMPLPIQYKQGEKLHYLEGAINVKKKKKTVGVNFAGPVASIRICKGVRYRLGSMSVQRQTVDSYDMSDEGIFYITNMRIGFLGKTQFSFNLNKLVSIQNGEAGLLIYKEGRQNPFMIALDDYDVPCTILSALLNQ